mmetsp:Transcript_20320/g.44404  ORF Transcript_20320/g.44404 Transcript_20320/m.44404 type:complete len:263 (-) Transcript_20320:1083-1871(-)
MAVTRTQATGHVHAVLHSSPNTRRFKECARFAWCTPHHTIPVPVHTTSPYDSSAAVVLALSPPAQRLQLHNTSSLGVTHLASRRDICSRRNSTSASTRLLPLRSTSAAHCCARSALPAQSCSPLGQAEGGCINSSRLARSASRLVPGCEGELEGEAERESHTAWYSGRARISASSCSRFLDTTHELSCDSAESWRVMMKSAACSMGSSVTSSDTTSAADMPDEAAISATAIMSSFVKGGLLVVLRSRLNMTLSSWGWQLSSR